MTPSEDAQAKQPTQEEEEGGEEKETELEIKTTEPIEIIDDETTTIIDCIHEIAYPPNWEGERMDERQTGMQINLQSLPEKPARIYKFELDPFQKASVACLEKGESVLVSAHTSAGKTVVAEYAIAMSLRDKQRVIYTSPIKALSNQKYRELFAEFNDVGLMTGDVTINPGASCLVMTTEILRSMLYRGSEVMREVKWVIFDEIHYMRDKERGVVWEETIIMLPDKVRFVFLSATIPNAKEFAEWIAKTHSQPCHVVYTDYRPTPLQHFIFPAGGNGLYLVVDEKCQFLEDNFQQALSAMVVPADKSKSAGKGKGKQGTNSDIYKIVKMVISRNYQPLIVFAFSKKECESLALQMAKLDFTDDDEKVLVDTVFKNAISSLSDDDKKLPQVENILPLLRRGIGIHHSGLLPILKEVIEILFQEGLVKTLFATETFSMGLNMPARTVIFTNVRKFDGKDFRWITGGEYIQMSGRAGRRGIDDRGIVILMVDEKMEPNVAKGMVKGTADALYSSFHLGYNMLLNLTRFEGIDPEALMRQSFHQFQCERKLPQRRLTLEKLEHRIEHLVIPDEPLVSEYYHLRTQLEKLKKAMRDAVNMPVHIMEFLQAGRLVKIVDGKTDWGWGIVVNFQRKRDAHGKTSATSAHDFIVDVLLNVGVDSEGRSPRVPTPPAKGQKSEIQVVPVLLNLIDSLSSVRVFIPKELRSADSRRSVQKSLSEVLSRFSFAPPLLDPIEDMNIEDPAFKKIIRRIETVEDRMSSKTEFQSPEMSKLCVAFEEKIELQNQIKEIKREIRQGDQVVMKEELKGMRKTLRRLGFVNKAGVVQIKGRVACEINTTDELLLTEMMFNGVFNDLTPNQICALLSCFVFQERGEENAKLPDDLVGPFRQLQEHARRVATVWKEAKLDVDVEEYVQKFQSHMMEVVTAWCNGAKFIEICKMTKVFEGSIIRCMRQLEEVLHQMAAAAKSIGNGELEAKFSEGTSKLRRDIVFAVSLYL